MTIPKRFIRVWFGNDVIPIQFEKWWADFKKIHPDYEFITITDFKQLYVPDEIAPILKKIKTYAGWSDVARILALY
jgi:mannosyltransferase OCH1-like enzyme